MRAMFGQAQCEESMSDGVLDPVIKLYEQVAREYPDTVYADLAQKRIDELKESGAQGFYAWFHAQNPKPPAAPKPDDKGTAEESKMEEPEGPRLESEKGPATDGEKPKSTPDSEPKEEQPAEKPKEEATEKPKDEAAEKPKDEAAEKPQEQPEKKSSDQPKSGDKQETAPSDEAAKPE